MVGDHHQQQKPAQNIQFYHPFHKAQNDYDCTSCAKLPKVLFFLDDSGFKPVSQVVNIPFRLRFATVLSGDSPPLLTDNRKLGHNKRVHRSRFAVRSSQFAVGCLRFAEQGSGYKLSL
jgi:hypothetical protein